MKILILGPYAYKNQKISGGVEAVLNNLKHGINLYEPDINVKIISGSDKAEAKIEVENNIIYIRHPKVKFGSIFLSTYPYRVENFLKKGDFDILHAHSMDFSYHGYKIQEKLLFTLHGIPQEEKKFLPKYEQPFYHLLYVKRFEKILKYLRYLVSINPYAKEIVKNKTNATIYDICNPIPDDIFELKNKYQENRMLYIGIISERKNLFTLIKALNIIRKKRIKFKLVVAGKIVDQGYFDKIIDYVNKNNLNNYFEYLGKITEEQKYEEYSKMSFLILPSIQETAPMVISETFAAGKPVIASNLCGIPYMIDDGKNGLLINPSDETDISDKILYLMENPGVITSMGINGKKYALENHSLKVVVKKYRVAYEEIIANQ
jgi:glycosyltransferase involved in cell wall biosynthesis